MDAVNEETLMSYYQLLEDTLKTNGLKNFPTQIYNVDETGVPLNPKPPKTAVPKGMKKHRYQLPGQKGQITVAHGLWQCCWKCTATFNNLRCHKYTACLVI